MNKTQLKAFFDAEFAANKLQFEESGDSTLIVRRSITKQDLRPGGTVSGPVMMSLADSAMYAAVLQQTGLSMVVTSSLTINFFRRPLADADLLAKVELLKTGRSLIIGDVRLYSEGQSKMLAQANVTYSVPPSISK